MAPRGNGSRAGTRPVGRGRAKSPGRARRGEGRLVDGVSELLSLTGKHLPTAGEAREQLSQAARDLVQRAIPDELVREMVTVSAPVARLGGRSQLGAVALSRALKLLAQPPYAREAAKEHLTFEEIAKVVDRTPRVVSGWAADGLLGDPRPAGRTRKWGRDALERARLVDYLLRHGVPRTEIVEAAQRGRLAMLVLTRTLAGNNTVSRAEVADQAGLPIQLVDELTAALGLAAGEGEEGVYSPREVHAFRLLGALRSVFEDEDLIEVGSVVGRAMHEVAEASLELFRRRFARSIAEAGAGELEMILRLATMIDLTTPTTGPLLELVLRRQLEVTGRSEAVIELERAGGAIDGSVEQAVGFADIVGFTSASARMSALEVSQLAARLLRTTEKVFPAHGARMVKTMGDAVMYTAPDALSAAAAAGDLVRAWEADDGALHLRVGIAHGPMLRAYADYFGRTVNIASRLSDVAPPNRILLQKPARAIRPASWRSRGLKADTAEDQKLKGIDTPVAVIELTPLRHGTAASVRRAETRSD